MPEIDPAISALALWCSHRDGEAPTRTQGDVIWYGPDFEDLPLHEQTGVLAHHVLHVALRHSGRMGAMATRIGPGFDRDLFNIACDGLINDLLIKGGHALSRPCVGATELLRNGVQNPPAPSTVLAEWDAERLYLELCVGAKRSAGKDRSSAEQVLQSGFLPDLSSSDDAQTAPEVWAERIGQGLGTGQSAGLGIGTVCARFGDVPTARIPWELVLRRRLLRALAERPRLSHKRPARGWIARDAQARQQGRVTPVFEPGHARDRLRHRLVLALDTSSSITDIQLSLFSSEALGAGRRSGAEVFLLGFDTEVHTRTRMDGALHMPPLEFRRGGGTSFTSVLAEAARLRPSLIVMLTDLDGETGPPPPVPVLWVVPEAVEEQPPFGAVVAIPS